MIDTLELEIRHVEGVSYVGIDQRAEQWVVEVVASPGVLRSAMRAAVLEVAQVHLEGDILVEVVEPALKRAGPVRVQLLVALDWPEQNQVEIHLAYKGRRSTATAALDDPMGAARATLAALEGFGFEVPFSMVSASILASGQVALSVTVTLESIAEGSIRRGIASAPATAEAAARATLNALNRFLEAMPTGLNLP